MTIKTIRSNSKSPHHHHHDPQMLGYGLENGFIVSSTHHKSHRSNIIQKMIAGAVTTLAGITIVYLRKRKKRRVFKIGEDVVSKLGRDKFLGGEVGNTNVYCVPGTAKYVLRIDTDTFQCETVGPFLSDVVTSSLKRNEFKWLRAIRDRNGILWGLPSNANRVIKITPPRGTEAEKIEFVGPELYPGTIWKWHGAQLASNGKIYAIPCNALRVLCVNTETGEVKMIGDEDLTGRQKWYV